jgi:hypothetical protein
MTRPILTAPLCRGERMTTFAISPPAQQWRLRVTLGLTVVVTRIPKTTEHLAAGTYWRIEGLGGYIEDRMATGGPQAAANEAGRVLDELRKRIAGMGRDEA